MYKGYKLLYVNGCSHSAGGGLEGIEVKNLYKSRYNIEYSDHKECIYPYYLSRMLKIGLVNEARSGGSLGRVARMAFDFLEVNWHRRHEIIFLLQKPQPGRIEVYSNQEKCHLIMNTYPDGRYSYTTKDYRIPNMHHIWDKKQPLYEEYFNNFYDQDVYRKVENRLFLGFYYWCKKENIAIKLITGPDYPYIYSVEKDDVFSYDSNDYDLVFWATQNQKLIIDEVGFEDCHPGILGHREYAKRLKLFFDSKLKSNEQTSV